MKNKPPLPPQHPKNKSRPVKAFLVCVAIVVIGAVTYSPVSGFGLISYDDPEYISWNTAIREGLTWSGLKWAFTTGYTGNWHPLTWVSYMLDYQFFGGTSRSMHLTNVFFHLANSLLLFLLLRKMTGTLWRS